MLGLWSKGKLAWKVEVPEGNPLDCNESAMRLATLSGDRVITTYTNKKTDIATLTAFAIASGTRLWSTGIPKEVGRPLLLAVESGQLWVEVDGPSTKDAILVFDAKEGRFRFGVTSGGSKVLTSLETAP
jgi:outer membrane protein assembly factor BamB